MRNLVIGLAIAALVGLATNSALAAGPAHAKKGPAKVQFVAHPGHHGPAHHGHHGPHHHRGWHRPPVYRPPAIVPYPIVRPPVYRYYRYPYYGYPYYGYPYYLGPRGIGYYRSGVGISIGF